MGRGLAAPADVIARQPALYSVGDDARLPPEVADSTRARRSMAVPDGLERLPRTGLDLDAVTVPVGIAPFEIGAGQAPAVAAIMAASGLD